MMDNFTATMIAEYGIEYCDGTEHVVTEEEYLEAWQHLVDTGLAWTLQGWFGRTAQSLIDGGHIHE